MNLDKGFGVRAVGSVDEPHSDADGRGGGEQENKQEQAEELAALFAVTSSASCHGDWFFRLIAGVDYCLLQGLEMNDAYQLILYRFSSFGREMMMSFESTVLKVLNGTDGADRFTLKRWKKLRK